ncbi:hypothetical protein NsoK4_09770 [Nitrosopumilus sp. K4]|uniref:hypothetical protein n=1 Tax=Nitrosopumilus sp. K4 TaxID=2795383 RepID=UPI001BA5747B|nr:hypothetical protein [Nitrosopumilus sp. K4]QUC64682.1 hypothetical protein NsoK4_09770 [Nitrosopumilus sp. K4]
MVRDSKKKEDRPKESEFKKFLKKRAPVYLGVITLVIVFIVPELTKGDLQSSFPEDLSEQEKQALDKIMSYRGPNGKGLSVLDAISNKIAEEYPNEKIYDNKKTNVDVTITNTDVDEFQVILDFKSYKGELNYDWSVNVETSDISGNNQNGKHIIDLVDFYD